MDRIVSGAVCALLVSGCGPAVSSAPFVSRAPNPAVHEIRLYSTRLPRCPYEEVGLVQAKRRDHFFRHTSLEGAVDAVRRRARAMGGDAVVMLGQTQTVDGARVVSAVSLGATEWFGGTVIRFTDATCPEPDE